MRTLFFNEGNLGSQVMGQAQLESTLRAHVGGHSVRFAELGRPGRLGIALAVRPLPGLRGLGVELGPSRWLAVQAARARVRLGREIDRGRPDVVHVHSHSVALASVGLMQRVPTALSVDVTATCWSDMPAWRTTKAGPVVERRAIAAAEARAFEAASVVLAWSAWVRRTVERAAPRARVVEHHVGLDLDRFSPGPREPRDVPRVLFVGGRFADKGGPDLLAALEPELGRTVEVDVVTPVGVEPRPGVRVHRLGPGDPRLMELRRQADVLCLPSGADAVPWAVLEAMACGVPVVASDVGGIPDLLGGTGLVVPWHDRRALREALLAVLEDEPRRGALGVAARRRCEERFDAAVQVPALLALLADLAR